ncbi:MAG TPA: FG-GAP-like repeat-containing protein [Bacteroidia bacterium]|jgi:hypothetical protein|nr:FG-GAP-like repeat-containing protein [Bacteroidia bacterium]
MKKIITLLAITFCLNVNAQLCLLHNGNYNVEVGPIPNPNQVISADFNNDGKLDLATSDQASGQVSILLGNATGSYTLANIYSIGGASSVASADFDGDGFKDLAVANPGNGVTVLLGAGNGSFGTATTFTVGGTLNSVIAVDINTDGKIDLVTSNGNNHNVSVLLGNGNGSFGSASLFAAGTNTQPTSVISADFNSDGNLDLVTANGGSSNVSLLLGTGVGSFITPSTFTTGTGTSPVCVITADFNEDGNLDLATANANPANNISILLGDGAGSFGVATNFAVGTGPYSITSADFNIDGHIDLVVANLVTSNIISVLLGNGTGSFGSANNYTTGTGTVTTNPHSVISADIDNDGKPDLAVANSATNDVAIFLNTLPTVIISGTTSICTGKFTTLTASGANSYLWSTNAGSATTNSVIVAPTSNTTYTVTGNKYGCTVSQTVLVTLNALPAVSVNSSSICIGNTATLTANGATTYTWNTSATGVTITPSPTTTTHYTVTGTDANGCVNKNTATVTVNILPAVSVNSSSICIGNTATLTANGATTYTWNIGATGAAITPSPTTTTHYTVNGTDANNCSNIATSTVSVNDLPVVSVTSNTASLCSGTSATLTGSGANTYTWSTNQTGINITITPTVNTTYTVTGTDANNCINMDTLTQVVINCATTDVRQAEVNNNEINIYPNPNNGSFIIETSSPEQQIIKIFDVTGKLVLNQSINEKTSIDANDLNAGIYNISILSSTGIVNKRIVITK